VGFVGVRDATNLGHERVFWQNPDDCDRDHFAMIASEHYSELERENGHLVGSRKLANYVSADTDLRQFDVNDRQFSFYDVRVCTILDKVT
jgi:hypothetical protein